MTRKAQLAALLCTSALLMPAAAFGQANQTQGEPAAKMEEGQQTQTQGQQPQTGQAATQQEQQPADTAAMPSAEEFAKKAAMSNQFEIESSQIALDKAENDRVKEFAQRMIDDHTAASDKLKQAAESAEAQIQLPDSLDQEHQQKIDQLNQAEGAEFDRQYVDMQVEGHEQAVELFSSYAENGDDPELKQFAENTLPTLEEHQQMIRDISQDPALVAAAEGQQQPATGTQTAQDQDQPSEMQATEGATQPSDMQAAEGATQPSDMQTAEGETQPSDMQTAEGETQPSDMQTAEGETQPSDMQAAEGDDQLAAKREALGSISAEELQGTTVYGSAGEEVGDVGDIVLATNGEIEAIVVDVGGFLGIGEKSVAIQLADLEVQQGENGELTLRVNQTKEQLENAPEYEREQ